MDIKQNIEILEKVEKTVEEILEKNGRPSLLTLGLVTGLAASPTNMSNQPEKAPVVRVEEKKDSFGKRPEDRFLHNIGEVESAGGRNLAHKPTQYGVQKGATAIGRWALMPNTIREVAKRYKINIPSHLSDSQIKKLMNSDSDLELKVARALASHVLKIHKGDMLKAAYAWKYGHNLKPHQIDPEKLKNDPYLVNFKELSLGRSVQGLTPDSDALNKNEQTTASLAKERAELASLVKEAPSVNINPDHGLQIADAYENMQHDPHNPDVKNAYNALIQETKEQFSNLLSKGLKVSKMHPEMENPYKTSKDMHNDVENNGHLWYYPTESGYGLNEQGKTHPMLQSSGFFHDGKELLVNDLFRIVHDVNGHYLGGKSGFGPKGEHQAYLTHKKMYSPLAQKALFTETVGQNNWTNFSKTHGEKNRKDPKNTVYAEQKAGLMPEEFMRKNWHS